MPIAARRIVFGLVLALATQHAAADEPAVSVRAADHPGFGRLVFDLAPTADLVMQQDGDRLVLRVDPPRALAAPPRLPRNLRAMAVAADAATLTLAVGTKVRRLRVDGRVLLDLIDPVAGGGTEATSSPPPAATSKRAGPQREAIRVPQVPAHVARAQRATPETPEVWQTAPAATQIAPEPTGSSAADQHEQNSGTAAASVAGDPPPGPIASSDRPADVDAFQEQGGTSSDRADTSPSSLALVATLAASPAPGAGRAAIIPFGPEVGAAAFARDEEALVVFDDRRPVDLAGLRDDPAFGGAAVQLLPTATLIRIRPPPKFGVVLTRLAGGWALSVAHPSAPATPIRSEVQAQGLVLAAQGVGHSIVVIDPQTGARLLVGTVRVAGQHIPATLRGPEFAVLPTWLGIAVEPLSDRINLHAEVDGFRLTTDSGDTLALDRLPGAGAALSDAAALTRRFDIPLLNADALQLRLRAMLAEAAATASAGRLRARLDAARVLIALGQGAEAQALLGLAVGEDPHGADDPDANGLASLAALLAGRLDASAGIEDPRLTGTDEVAFWRAMRMAQAQEGSPAAAAALQATSGLLLLYPDPLRRRLAPLVAETLALGGQPDLAAQLAATLGAQADMTLAQGIAQEARGDVDGALATYDAAAARRDRLLRIRAGARAVELRLAHGKIDQTEAADALEKLAFIWRGDGRELSLHRRAAALQAEAGHFRAALATLREAEIGAPDHAVELQAQAAEVFATLLRGNALDRLPPLELAALVDENADRLPGGSAGEMLASRLADRLLALDLPKRAAAILEPLMRAAPEGATRAALGARLGEAWLDADQSRSALAALAASASDNLPADVAAPRTLLLARALTRLGDVPRAVAALTALGTPGAESRRAVLLEGARDWPAALAALQDVADRDVPPSGPLDDAQRALVLRVAEAAAQVGDRATLAALSARDGARMATGRIGDMFKLLTAPPIDRATDLPRAAEEVAAARDVPASLAALGRSVPPR